MERPIPPTGTTPAAAKKRRLLPRTWRGYAGILLCMLLLVLTVAWMLSRLTPSWHRPMDSRADGFDTLATNAQNTFFEFRNMVERSPKEASQTWSISQDQLNCYLAKIFHLPINEKGQVVIPSPPPAFSEPVVTFNPGTVTVSARLAKIPGPNPLGGVGSLVYSVKVMPGAGGDPPMALIQLKSVWIGALPLPTSVAAGRIQALAPQVARALTEALEMQMNSSGVMKAETQIEQATQGVANGTPFPLRYAIDRKQFTVTNIAVEEGKLSLSLSPSALAPPTTMVTAPR